MKLYPAIDLRGGQAVRLYQGDYDQMTVYNADPAAQAREFIAAGAKYLHVVDLDGAKDDTTANMTTMCCTVPWQLASWAQHIRLWRGAWQICCPMRWQNILRRATAEWNPLRLVRFMLCWLPLFFTK